MSTTSPQETVNGEEGKGTARLLPQARATTMQMVDVHLTMVIPTDVVHQLMVVLHLMEIPALRILNEPGNDRTLPTLVEVTAGTAQVPRLLRGRKAAPASIVMTRVMDLHHIYDKALHRPLVVIIRALKTTDEALDMSDRPHRCLVAAREATAVRDNLLTPTSIRMHHQHLS